MGSNRHMNIFHHYSQAGALPIENNLSRGLAILLEEYPAFFLLFLEKLQEKLREKADGTFISYPKDGYQVDFQRRTDSFGEAEQLMGVALTAQELSGEDVGAVQTSEDYRPVTDISVNYDDTLIFIEVKRNETDCRRQLKEQMENYVKNVLASGRGMDTAPARRLISITWTDVAVLLKRYMGLCGGRAERLVTDYYEDLVYHYPAWSPVERLERLNPGESSRIEQRLAAIKEQYRKDYVPDGQLLYGRGAIPIDFGYASECNLFFEPDFLCENGKRRPGIVIGIWPSDTCSQYWSLKGKGKDFSFAEQVFSTVVPPDFPDFGKICLRVRPYLKLCHFNKGIGWLYREESTVKNNVSAWISLADELTGKWKRTDWPEFLQKITDSGLFGTEKRGEFQAEFQEKFENSERSYLTVSMGFEMFACLEFGQAQDVEGGKYPGLDMEKLIDQVLKAMKKRIEEN